jgi:hypothetical protein
MAGDDEQFSMGSIYRVGYDHNYVPKHIFKFFFTIMGALLLNEAIILAIYSNSKMI